MMMVTTICTSFGAFVRPGSFTWSLAEFRHVPRAAFWFQTSPFGQTIALLFSARAQIMEKTTAEVVDFYYGCWKKSTHYQIWKQRQRPAAQLPRVTPAVSSNPQASQP